MIYYVDNANGNDNCDGLSPEGAKRDYKSIPLAAGDTLLLKRGNVYYRMFDLVSGEDGNPITYGAYGEGEMPLITGGTDLSCPEYWVKTDRENIWECIHPTDGDVGNFVFNDDECTSGMRWTLDELVRDGEQGDFFDQRFTENFFSLRWYQIRTLPQGLYMYSVGNPATVYKKIIAVDYGKHILMGIKSNVILDGLCFSNSSVHALAMGDKEKRNVTVRNCEFKNIGGCVWDYDRRIRLGNAIEFWDETEDVLVENCVFKNIYDSCVTHQGPNATCSTASRFNVRGCRFENYGMAAFEYRDRLPIDSEFVGNVCIGAGCGFAMKGEELPRYSEIWPEPMGHHVFLWRIYAPSEGSSLLIADNVFGDAPVGAAIYSIIDPAAEAKITLKNNKYTRNDTLLVRFGGNNYSDLEAYKVACGVDAGSAYVN